MNIKNKTNSLLFLFVNSLFAMSAFSQDLTKGVFNIDNTDAAKYDFLISKIENIDVVQLGEISHGDGTTFNRKVELIQFLHEKLDYDVVLFESPFAQIEMINQDKSITNGNAIDSISNHIFTMWRESQEVQNIFNYMQEEEMILSGFDCQITKNDAVIIDSLKLRYDKVFLERNMDLSFYETLQVLLDKRYTSKNHISKRKRVQFIRDLTILINSDIEGSNTTFWAQYLISLKGCALAYWQDNPYKGMMYRDQYMAKNLLWLLNNTYKDKKVIVWAHSIHVSKNYKEVYKWHNRVKLFTPNRLKYCNDYLKDSINSYSISFIYNEGKTSKLDFEIKRLPTSLEALLGQNHLEAFIDLKTFNFPKKTPVNGVYSNPKLGTKYYDKWSEVFDAFYFINKMEVPTPIK